MTRILLVRHGQTSWNQSARYQGHTDIELSPAGCRQAELLAKRLSALQLEAVYASDLQRAMATARILAAPHQLEVQAVRELREIHFGAWEGLTYKEIQERYKEVADRWYASPATVRIPEGETYTEVKERSYAVIEKLAAKHDGGTIMVVTHGGTIRTIVCGLLGLDLNQSFRINQDNTALNIIEFYDSYGILKLLNDTSHLAAVAEGI
jgi:alpha-ribazole phosphatase